VGDLHSLPDVRFDFEGALNLARSCWALAGEVSSTQSARVNAAGIAREHWQGTFREHFDHGMATASSDANVLADKLRATATQFALAWVRAKTEQYNREWYREKERKQREQAWYQTVWYGAFGDPIDYGRPKPSPAQPVPPSFLPTAH
jgi:hypothetical protein